MSTLATKRADLYQRLEDGSNPYGDSVVMKEMLCRIDPASIVRICDAAMQVLQLLTLNERQQQQSNDLPALDHS